MSCMGNLLAGVMPWPHALVKSPVFRAARVNKFLKPELQLPHGTKPRRNPAPFNITADHGGDDRVDRRSETTFSAAVRGALDALDARVSRAGRLGSTAILTAMTALGVAALHVLLRRLEGV